MSNAEPGLGLWVGGHDSRHGCDPEQFPELDRFEACVTERLAARTAACHVYGAVDFDPRRKGYWHLERLAVTASCRPKSKPWSAM